MDEGTLTRTKEMLDDMHISYDISDCYVDRERLAGYPYVFASSYRQMDADYQKMLASYAEEEKREPWVRGQGIGGIMDFSYLDLRDELGIIFECYREDAD